MIEYIVLGLIAVGLIVLFSRMHHMSGKLFRFLVIFLIALVLFGVLLAYINGIDMSQSDGLIKAGKLYGAWLGNAGKNIAKITGYAVHQDWSTNVSAILNNTNISAAG